MELKNSYSYSTDCCSVSSIHCVFKVLSWCPGLTIIICLVFLTCLTYFQQILYWFILTVVCRLGSVCAETVQSFQQWDREPSRHYLHLLEESPAGGRLLWKLFEGASLIYLWIGGKSDQLDQMSGDRNTIRDSSDTCVICHIVSRWQRCHRIACKEAAEIMIFYKIRLCHLWDFFNEVIYFLLRLC